MQISMNTVVTMTYELKNSKGELLEESKEPVAYLHGGYEVEVTLEPIDAFGDYDEELVQIEPESAFPAEQLKEGMQFEGEDETGEVILYTITNIADGKVVVDGNHPWAGERLLFKATITDVRKARTEEVDHKHVHGAGGHHH
jgi:FKBP-type peptidyl-prolyl cis-trans isomerase SlyD